MRISEGRVRQIIREEASRLLGEAWEPDRIGVTIAGHRVNGIDDLLVDRVSKADPPEVFVAGSPAFMQAYNVGEMQTPFAKSYMDIHGNDRVFRGLSQVNFKRGQRVFIPALWNKGTPYSGLGTVHSTGLIYDDFGRDLTYVLIDFDDAEGGASSKMWGRAFIRKVSGVDRREERQRADYFMKSFPPAGYSEAPANLAPRPKLRPEKSEPDPDDDRPLSRKEMLRQRFEKERDRVRGDISKGGSGGGWR